MAAHVLGWQSVHWHQGYHDYVGQEPGCTVESRVPRFTEQDDLMATIQTALQQLGYEVQATPVPEGWRVQVDGAAATLRTLPLALCASVWRAMQQR